VIVKRRNLTVNNIRIIPKWIMLVLSLGLVPPVWSAPVGGKLPDAHTITITVSRDKEEGGKAATGGEMAIGGGQKKGCNDYAAYDNCSACGTDEVCQKVKIKGRTDLQCYECAGKAQPPVNKMPKDITISGKKTGGGSKASGKLPNAHTITITVTRDKKKPASGKKPGEVTFPGGGPKDITVGGNEDRAEQPVKPLPSYKQNEGCDYLKPPKMAGAGSVGLNGLPKSFPLPPLTNKTVPWRVTVLGGNIYAIGVSTGLKDTADFIKKELPIRGWKIDKNAKPSPQAKKSSVHIFFYNADYCGWVTISGKGAPAATGMYVGIRKRARGMR